MTEKKKFCFKILFTKQYLIVSVDKYLKGNCTLPLTTFYFWPREDGWKLMKADLDSKPWLTNELRVEILNDFSQLINYWINNPKKHFPIKKTNSDIEFKVLGSL